jgi:hypothetical protein
MKRALLFVVVALPAVFAVVPAGAQDGSVYRWVDKDGTPHYQDRPPEGGDATELSLRYRATDPEAIAAARKKKDELASVAALREQQQGEEAAGETAEKQKVIQERNDGCAKAKERQQRYETAHRLYKPGPDGQRKYLSDQELDSARVAARNDVAEWCGS